MTSVLLVDDEPAVRDVMARWVTSFGLSPHTASSADEALASLRRRDYDLAVVDVMMPGHDGLWLLEQMHHDCPNTAVVLATAYTELLDEDRPPSCADLLVKPFQRERFALAMERGRHWHREALQDRRWHAQLVTELQDGIQQVAASIGRRLADGAGDAEAVGAVAAERTPRTVAHGARVMRYVGAIGREMGVDEETASAAAIAARFHDVGKAAMPLALLTKPSPLSDDEQAIMRRHVDIGADLLATLASLAGAAPLVRSSHEWFGGGGYPRGLAADAIPLGGRMIAVADAYDAITEDRAYRHGARTTDAVEELLRCCPTQFDPQVVDAFLRVLSRH